MDEVIENAEGNCVLERVLKPSDGNRLNPKKKKAGKKEEKSIHEPTKVLNTYNILDSELPFENLINEEV